MDAKAAATAVDPDIARLQSLIMYVFAAAGLPAIAAIVAGMSLAMRFLPGW
jgi:hypothetical protein